MTSFLRTLLLLALAGALSACGGGGGSTTPSLDVPTVTPADGAVGVARDVVVSAVSTNQLRGDTDPSNLVLLLNGVPVAGTPSFDGNGTLSFVADQPLAMLSEYTATVKQGIADVNGAVLPQDVSWSFTTRDGEWSALQESSAVFAGSAVGGQVPYQLLMNKQGDAMLVWQRKDTSAGEAHVWAQRYVNSSWGVAQQLDTDSGMNASNPHASMDEAGNVLVAWTQQRASGEDYINGRYFDAGSGWRLPANLSSVVASALRADYAKVALAGNDTGIVAWEEYSPSGTATKSKLFDFSNGFQVGMLTQSQGSGVNPQVAMDDAGNGMVAWEDHRVTDKIAISYRRFVKGVNGASDAWDTTSTIIATTDATTPFHAPQLAINPATGKAALAWYQSMDSNGDQLVLWSINGSIAGFTAGQEEQLVTLNDQGAILGRSAAIQPKMQLGVDDQSNTLVVWRERVAAGTASSIAIKARQRTTAGVWQPIETLDATPSTIVALYRPAASLVLKGDGSAWVAWQTDTMTTTGSIKYNEVRVMRYLPEGGWQAAETLIDYSRDVAAGGDRPDGTTQMLRQPGINNTMAQLGISAAGEVLLSVPANCTTGNDCLLLKHFQ